MRKCSYTKTDPKSHWHDTGEGGSLLDFPWGGGSGPPELPSGSAT